MVKISAAPEAPEGAIALENPDSLTDLLRAPSLRSGFFIDFYFTFALFQATVNAFMEGSAITRLDLTRCSFPSEELAGNVFRRNTNTCVSYIRIASPLEPALYSALATVLPLNSTLQELSLEVLPSDDNPGARVDW